MASTSAKVTYGVILGLVLGVAIGYSAAAVNLGILLVLLAVPAWLYLRWRRGGRGRLHNHGLPWSRDDNASVFRRSARELGRTVRATRIRRGQLGARNRKDRAAWRGRTHR